jgi:hypothetical protein
MMTKMNRRNFLRSIGIAIAAVFTACVGGKEEIDDVGMRMIERWRDSDNPGTVWFLSDNGDDDNDGLTPETAKKTIASILFNLPESGEINICLGG